MGEPVSSGNRDTVSIQGLEDVFASTVETSTEDTGQLNDPGWSLTDAAEAFSVTDRTVRRWIKQHRIPAWKVVGPRGPEWRVQPGSKPSTEDIHTGSLLTTVDNSPDTGLLDLVRELQHKLDAAQEQLNGASFRNGYLESQVNSLTRELESHKDTIKLLTDSQHKTGWWTIVCSWFKGR